MASDNSGERVSSDETFDAQCTTCETQNKTVEAEKYCVDCRDYYCLSCLKMHATLPALKGHKLLDKKDGQSGKLLSLPTERCERHNFKAVDMFCENHNAIGCSTCVAVDHRDCKDVFYIPEFIESKNKVIPEILQRMNNVVEKLNDFHNVFRDERTALNSNKDAEIETIERLGKKLEKKIQEATEQALIKVKDKYESLRGKIDKDIDKIKIKLESFETFQNLINSTVKNKPQTFVAAKLHESKIEEMESACLDMERIKLGKRIHFAQNKDNDLIRNDFLSIGHVNIVPYDFVAKGTVNVKLSTDIRACNMLGSCVLPCGSVVFADFNNENIKLLSLNTMKIEDHYQVESKPNDVCYIERNEICVACCPDQIKMFRVTNKLLPTYEFCFNFYCSGVAYLDNKMYMVGNSNKIHEVNMKGQILRTISPLPDVNDNSISPYHICVSKKNKHIFVSDRTGTGKVMCMNSNGKVLNVVSDEAQGPYDIAEAGDGNVFICGFHSQNVILLNEMGKYVRTVIDNGLSGSPASICYDCERTRLYVSNFMRDEIQIFEAE